jgi:hypothetical protein
MIPNPARRCLPHEPEREVNRLRAIWSPVDEIAVEHENVLIVGPVKIPLSVGFDDRRSPADLSDCE